MLQARLGPWPTQEPCNFKGGRRCNQYLSSLRRLELPGASKEGQHMEARSKGSQSTVLPLPALAWVRGTEPIIWHIVSLMLLFEQQLKPAAVLVVRREHSHGHDKFDPP